MIRYLVLLIALTLPQILNAQTSAFNYQGRLTEASNPANGPFQMQFKLFDSPGGLGQIGSTIADIPVTVTQGIFSVKLDFGANAMSGANRWLEIAVRHNSGESYTTLSPREQIASSPYAVRTLSAASADNAAALGGLPASEYLTTNSGIRNQTTQQPSANFNISGNGQFGGHVAIGGPINSVHRLAIQTNSGNGIHTQTDIGGGYGIFAISAAPTGEGVGIYAKTNSPVGYSGYFDGRAVFTADVSIGGITPARRLHVDGRARVSLIPLEQSTASLCFNGVGDLLQCGGSSLKWKTDVRPLDLGLKAVLRLRPITFKWKEGGTADIGLGAEDVASVAPDLVWKDQQGAPQGVKYEKLSMLLVKAIKEQQEQIEVLKRANAKLSGAVVRLERKVTNLRISKQRRR